MSGRRKTALLVVAVATVLVLLLTAGVGTWRIISHKVANYAVGFPGKAFELSCTTDKSSYNEGETVTLHFTVTNVARVPVPYYRGDKIFMLTTEPDDDAGPGYPVPPDFVSVDPERVSESGKISRRFGRAQQPIEFESSGERTLWPGDTLTFDVEMGIARSPGFLGKIMLDQNISGMPGEHYDIRKSNQLFLRDGRSLVSNEFTYKVKPAEPHQSRSVSSVPPY